MFSRFRSWLRSRRARLIYWWKLAPLEMIVEGDEIPEWYYSYAIGRALAAARKIDPSFNPE